MAGHRSFEFIRTQSNLDYEAAAKWGAFEFSPHETMMTLLLMLVIILLVGVLCMPFIGLWGVLPAPVIAWFAAPRIVGNLKGSKPRSWQYDLIHKYGIPHIFAMPGVRQYHFRRAFSKKTWDGARRLVRSPWVKAKTGGIVPTQPWHLTYGLPAIRVWSPTKKRFGRSLTPQPRLGGYAIMSRVYRPGAGRIPDYRRHAVIPKDETGRAAMQDFIVERQPWRFV